MAKKDNINDSAQPATLSCFVTGRQRRRAAVGYLNEAEFHSPQPTELSSETPEKHNNGVAVSPQRLHLH